MLDLDKKVARHLANVCDGVCANLFDGMKFARRKAVEWSKRREEFVKRAGFVLMVELAVHDKPAANLTLEPISSSDELGMRFNLRF